MTILIINAFLVRVICIGSRGLVLTINDAMGTHIIRVFMGMNMYILQLAGFFQNIGKQIQCSYIIMQTISYAMISRYE